MIQGLGSIRSADAVAFRVWAPHAQQVSGCRFARGGQCLTRQLTVTTSLKQQGRDVMSHTALSTHNLSLAGIMTILVSGRLITKKTSYS